MRDSIAQLASLILWDIEAIKISLDRPFKLASGNFSPIYIDCRRVISDSAAMDLVTACAHMIYEAGNLNAEIIAGGETAGIPFASFLAQRLAKPMVYVRKRPKDYGTGSLVDGGSVTARTVLLVEDLITDGGSKLSFVRSLREQGAVVNDCIVLFDRQQNGEQVLGGESVMLHAITTLQTALDMGVASGRLSTAMMSDIQGYLSNPRDWHESRSLDFRSIGD